MPRVCDCCHQPRRFGPFRSLQAQLPWRDDQLCQTTPDPSCRVRGMKKKNELGPLIRTQREAFRLTQRELALKLGVKASHVAYIEGGLRRPSLSLVRKLAETLGLNKQKLLLMTYPEARFLITPAKEEPHKPEAVWEEFSADR